MKFSEVVLVSTFLRSSMRRWKNAKDDLCINWRARCLDCQIPLFGENIRCQVCYNMWLDRMMEVDPPQDFDGGYVEGGYCEGSCCQQEELTQPQEKFYTQMEHGVAVKYCSACEEPADQCLCNGEDIYIGCRICGDNCYNGDYPQWRFCSRRCMTYESRHDRYY